MINERLAQKRAIVEARENRAKLLKPSIDELHKKVLDWDYCDLEKSSEKVMKRFLLVLMFKANLRSVPVRFDSAAQYLSVFYPLLLEEFRSQLQKEKEESSKFILLVDNLVAASPSPAILANFDKMNDFNFAELKLGKAVDDLGLGHDDIVCITSQKDKVSCIELNPYVLENLCTWKSREIGY